MKYIIMVISALIFAGCSSSLKKQCKKTNWYKHGKSIALSGESIHADNLSHQCTQKKVVVNHEALKAGFNDGKGQYCDEQNVFTRGKNGQKVNLNICSKENLNTLKAKYTSGLRLFCQPERAYSEGSKGRALNPNCPEGLSKEYHQQYTRGRQFFLKETIQKNKSELLALNTELENKRKALASKESAFEVLDTVPLIETSSGEENTALSLAQQALSKKRSNLQRKINILKKQVNDLEKRKNFLENQTASAQSELRAIASTGN